MIVANTSVWFHLKLAPMKKICTLFALAFPILVSLADDAAFEIKLPAQSEYRIYFDGNPYNFRGNSFSFQQFPAGVHQLMVEQTVSSLPHRTIYNGLIYFEKDYRVSASIDPAGRLTITGKELLTGNAGIPLFFPPGGGFPSWNNGCPPNPWGNMNRFVSEADYKAILKSLDDAWFENQRQEIALQAIRHNNYSAEQIKGILKAFWYDSYRLTVAKEAYKYSRDKGNFFRVYEAFSFSSTGNSLSAYIREFVE